MLWVFTAHDLFLISKFTDFNTKFSKCTKLHEIKSMNRDEILVCFEWQVGVVNYTVARL